jgi:hypothetical protein
MTARGIVIVGSTRNPGIQESWIPDRVRDDSHGHCHCGLDPQSMKSWMPDQVRHDNS